jgi:hypothetical protein
VRRVVVMFDETSLALLEVLRHQLERTMSGDTATPVIAGAFMVNGSLFADAHTHPGGARRCCARRWARSGCGRRSAPRACSTRACCLAEATGLPQAVLDATAVADPRTTVRAEVERLLTSPLLSPKASVSGNVYEVATGRVSTTHDARYPKRRLATTSPGCDMCVTTTHPSRTR